ncbi:acetylserotonin O-methyltransferase-like [Branchiostoma floridae]|uniref:Acetylserotonin O-methyltransferase n=1 Tax=Branchiostoma floridae TaxID=7739 RepID=A0A9J7HQI2_BRAFL|nr:acetylserotonin O-methyltransferase-like [Branchiostoma floridae]
MDAEHEGRRILDIAEGFMKSQILFSSVKLGIFNLLETSDSPMTAGEISEAIGTDADATKRLLNACTGQRLLEKVNVDQETGDGEYQLSAGSRTYLTASSPTALTEFVGILGDYYRSPWQDLAQAVKEGAAFSARHGLAVDKTFEDVYRDEPNFTGAMAAVPAVFGAKTASAFDLSEFQSICDVGGCTGPLAYHLAAAYPQASVSVYDLPLVVKLAEEKRPAGDHAERVSFIAGDFFGDAPLPAADLYVLCRIIHDWNDDKALKILNKIHQSLPPGGGVLVADTILADDKTGPEVSNKYDLHMMLAAGSRERSGQELRRLLNKAGFTEVTINSNGYPFGHVLGRKPRI